LRREHLRNLALAALILCIILAVGYGWKTSLIVADTTPPEIREVFPEGSVEWRMAVDDEGRLIVKCWVKENLEMKEVTCSIYRYELLTWVKKETITLDLQEKLSGDIYLYRGTFTGGEYKPQTVESSPSGYQEPQMSWTLTTGVKYKLRFTAVDKAGHKDTYEATFKLYTTEEAVGGKGLVTGYVTVNGKRIEGPDDEVWVTSLNLVIRVYLTAGADEVQNIYCLLGGDRVADFAKKSGYWEATYRLPGDGKYSFMVQVLTKSGIDIQLASFTVSTGFYGLPRDRILMAIGATSVLGIAALYGYTATREVKRGGGGRRS